MPKPFDFPTGMIQFCHVNGKHPVCLTAYFTRTYSSLSFIVKKLNGDKVLVSIIGSFEFSRVLSTGLPSGTKRISDPSQHCLNSHAQKQFR